MNSMGFYLWGQQNPVFPVINEEAIQLLVVDT
jgi:hypothetical protein